MSQIRNVVSNLCVDTKHKGHTERVGLDECMKDTNHQSGEQVGPIHLFSSFEMSNSQVICSFLVLVTGVFSDMA